MKEKYINITVVVLIIAGLVLVGRAFAPKLFGHPSSHRAAGGVTSSGNDSAAKQFVEDQVPTGPTAIPTNIPALPFWSDLKLWEKSKTDYESKLKRSLIEISKEQRECVSYKNCRVFRYSGTSACGPARYDVETDENAQNIHRLTFALISAVESCGKGSKSKVSEFIENQVPPQKTFIDDKGHATGVSLSQNLRTRIEAQCPGQTPFRDCIVSAWSQWVCKNGCPPIDDGLKKLSKHAY